MTQAMDSGMDSSIDEFFDFAEATYQEHPTLTGTSGIDPAMCMNPSPQSSDEK